MNEWTFLNSLHNFNVGINNIYQTGKPKSAFEKLRFADNLGTCGVWYGCVLFCKSSLPFVAYDQIWETTQYIDVPCRWTICSVGREMDNCTHMSARRCFFSLPAISVASVACTEHGRIWFDDTIWWWWVRGYFLLLAI